jgi:hypothetical protein
MSKIRALLLILWLAGLITSVNAQDATPTPFAGCGDSEYPAWTNADGRCALKQTLSIEASFSYPEFLNTQPFAKAIVMQYITERQAEFWGNLAGGQFVETNSYPWTLDISDGVYVFSSDVVSIVFTEYEYTGGAHPNSWYTTFTFDLANEKQLSLADMLVDGDATLEVIAPLVQAQLTTMLGELSDVSWIEQGAAPTPENYASFTLTDDGLLILFPAYQVAPYVAGPQLVTLPYADLAGILKPEYIK